MGHYHGSFLYKSPGSQILTIVLFRCECDSCNDFDPSKGGSDNCSDRVEEESDPSSNDEDQVDDGGFVEGYWADSSSSLSASITAMVLCALVLCRF